MCTPRWRGGSARQCRISRASPFCRSSGDARHPSTGARGVRIPNSKFQIPNSKLPAATRTSFQRPSTRGFPLRFRAASLTRVDIRDDVVAERRVLRFGRELDAVTREPDRFIEVLTEIEIQLREIQMSFGERRVRFDREA